MFEKAFVINLPFKTDRLEIFQKSVPKCFGDVEVWPAVHGDSIRHPDWWHSGAGAWGCYRSHLQILEYCYQRQIESYVVFEDDAIFKPDSDESTRRFFDSLPADWEMAYLGGQLLHEIQHPPRRVNAEVMIPYNVNRTHCFSVHRRGYERLYRHLFAIPFEKHDHIDHHLGRLHESGSCKVYCPSKWIVGQDGGRSNISGNTNAATFWIDPERYVQVGRVEEKKSCVFLESTTDVAVELERRGWHRGHWQNDQRLDRGVCAAIASNDVQAELMKWYRYVIPEAVRQGNRCVCLFHPSLTIDVVQKLGVENLVHIKSENADHAEQQLIAFERGLITEPVSTEVPKRNLIYHIWPKSGSSVWRWNVEQLLKRIEQFDGVRSIGVVTSPDSDSLEDVQAAFAGHRIDNWIQFANDPKRGETVTFTKLLETLPTDDNSRTFYGHAKGVSHGENENVRSWAAMMYEVCLDNTEYVSASLDQYPVTGPFKNTREYAGQMVHGWHYSGTFFWFKNRELFSRNWRDVPPDYYGSEKYLGNLFTQAEAGCLFGDHVGWLYHVHEMSRVGGMLANWRKLGKPIEKAKVIPVYINARNLLTPLRKMVDYLLQIPNARPIIIDNDSTWGPLLEYYENDCPVKVVRTGVNGGKFGWSEHMLDHKAEGIEKYVVTDSDLELDGIPLDVLDVLSDGLDSHPGVTKVGLSLDFETIPDDYPMKQDVIDWECQFWRTRTGGFCHAGIDTTFAMRRASDPIAFETYGHRRADRPYCAGHWPWHWTPTVIEESEEIRHYIETCDTTGLHWTPRTADQLAIT